jgi:serine protease Do
MKNLLVRTLTPFVVVLGLVAGGPLHAQTAAAALPDFTELVERTGPTVVNIRTTTRLSAVHGGGTPQIPGLDENDPFYEFFRRFFPQPQPGPQQRPSPRGPRGERQVPRGLGSGFIISPDGYVMTNHHVVDGSEQITVTLADKREFSAKLIGSDQRTDVALLKIEANGLPAVRIGDSNRLRVGEWVIAIGSPFGLESTVTAGIVSAKARETGEFLPFIQTDVAVNPGNSGGPLINMRGEVVGINSQIFTTSGAFAGISFAIPIDEAMRVQEQLRVAGRVVRGRIGVTIGAVSREVAEAIGLAKPQGALVTNVDPDGPAAKAGVEAGDVVLRFDGRPIESQSDLPRIVGGTKPGNRVTMNGPDGARAGRAPDIRNFSHHRAHRPRQVDAGGPPAPALRRISVRSRDGAKMRRCSTPSMDLERERGITIKAQTAALRRPRRVHGDGAGATGIRRRPPRYTAADGLQPDRHAGPRRLFLRSEPLAVGLRRRAAGGRRHAGRRGADGGQLLHGDRARRRGGAGPEQDGPAAGRSRRGARPRSRT